MSAPETRDSQTFRDLRQRHKAQTKLLREQNHELLELRQQRARLKDALRRAAQDAYGGAADG